jgi:hypothetical protein
MTTDVQNGILRVARNTSMKHVARTFLTWFELDAPKGADLIYATGTDFVERYRTDSEGIVNAMTYVGKIARERLSYGEANIVIEEAQKLLRPNG